ncbi:MAG: M3 family metallopeptidase [Candidatus Cryptobacteroides sp.]
MKKSVISLTAAMFSLVSCNNTNPYFEEWDTPYGIPPFDKIEMKHHLPAVKEGIARQQAEIQAIIDNPQAPDFENTIAAMDRSGELLAKVCGVLFNVSESDASDEINAVVEKAMPLISDHSSSIYMNPALYDRVKAVYEADQSALTREQQMVLKNIYESFINNGVGLDAASQERLREINSELSVLGLTFGNNLLAESNAYKAEIGSSVANYYDEMATVADRDLRKKMFTLYSNRGNNGNANDNKAILLRIMELRIEKAKLLGYETPAAHILHDKMAGDPQTVDVFLQGIMSAAMKRAKEEVADMQAVMNEDIKAGLLPAGTVIQPWDFMYYAERVRRARFNFDESEAMQYFQVDNVRNGIFALAGRLYGLQFEPIEGVALYNPEAKAFKVSDADGSLIGVIITDYFSRETKRAGAWMTNFVEQYVDVDGTMVRPVIVNVCNFNAPSADKPSLLTIDQVGTAFHEFGHALHGLLSQCTYKTVSGTAVKRDFVELPSQINENWAFQKEVLATYAFHWQTGEVIPDALVAKIEAASKFNQGFTTGELAAASILDMKWHELTSVEGIDVDAFEKKCCEEMGLVDEIIPRYRSTYFNHIFGGSGYSAGYYSYLWAEVLDKDAFELFKQKGIFDRETAMSFRHNILEMGGSEEPMTLYLRFRGSQPDAAALIRARGL